MDRTTARRSPSGRREVRAECGGDGQRCERADLERLGNKDHTVDLRCLAMAARDTGLVHEDLDPRPHQFVTPCPRDRLLTLTQLGEALVDQKTVDLAVESCGVGPFLLGEGEEPAPVELRLVD